MGGYFYHGGGHVAPQRADRPVGVVGRGRGRKDLGGTLAAKEDGALVEYGKTADFGRAGGTHHGGGGDAVVIADIHGEEALVEPHGFHIDVSGEELGSARLDAHGALNKGQGALGGIKPQVLNAVFIGRYSAFNTFT